MFDKNFKIKVSGNWCEYQPNKHIDLREIISFECWVDQLGNPYRFHLKNGSYHYIERYEIGKQIENVLKEQQAKVEELQKQLSEYIFVAETIDEMYVKEVKSSEELQEEFAEDERFLKEQIKDKDLKISNLEYLQGMDKELIQTLQGRSKALQDKVNDLQKQYDQHDKWLLERNRDCNELYNINVKHVAEKAELQRRVDKAIRLLVEAELYQSEPNIDLAVKALKGEG